MAGFGGIFHTLNTGPSSASGMTSSPFITDTGVRFLLRGELALVRDGESERMGIACQGCEHVNLTVRPWSRCVACGSFLMDMTSTQLPASVRPLDYYTGMTSSVAASESETSVQVGLLGVSREVTRRPGGASRGQTRGRPGSVAADCYSSESSGSSDERLGELFKDGKYIQLPDPMYHH